MGRKPSRNKNLPQGMRARHRKSGTYYYLDTGGTPRCEIALGSDYALAVKKWAELTVNARPRHTELITFRYAAQRYQREILPQKALRTQQDNLKELAKLYEFFDTPPAPLDNIEPIHVRQYLDWRVQDTLKRLRNDGKNVKGTEGRVRAKMELAYLTGQRPADVLKLMRTDIQDGTICLVQNKTNKRLRIAIEGQLARLIKQIVKKSAYFGKIESLALLRNEKGETLTALALRARFDKAREKAAAIARAQGQHDLAASISTFQFRDLRAKAGTDKEEQAGMAAAKDQLGHVDEKMTYRYVRHRKGKRVTPTK